MSIRNRLLSTTFIPVVVGVGVGLSVAGCAMQSCSPCNPCQAAAACSPCNPCAANNPCAASNPCATNNPCSPCAAAACNPCAVECVVPRLAAACNPCNPCAAKSPCNPCAAACNPCNPCNPCGAAAAAELTDAEATAAYDCIKGSLAAGYGKSALVSDSGQPVASAYQGWQRYSTSAYVSGTHGGRLVQNYANAVARDYGKYENLRKLPTGSVLAKDSFMVRGGKVVAGPFFVMEKMPEGFNADSGNWRYTLVMPDGKLVGTTNGKGSANVEFCYGCHMAAEDTDSAMFLPEEYRVKF